MNVIRAKNLIKDYNSFRAVNNIDFEIQEGECFGFLGPNGAGKTTVMRILYCFMPPSSGSVEVFGTDVLTKPSLIKSKIGVMPQEDNLDVDHSNILSLSGGMKRSLSLARALINNPEILILDEPTTGLDPYNRRMVWNKLNDLKSKNTTLVLTTHYMEEADKLCDRVAIMDAGRILTIDSPSNLKKIHGGTLEDVYLKLTGRPLES